MLKNLFISKVRIRILEKYMSDTKASYHVRGLVRELGEEINAVRRELLNLQDAGILKSAKDGNKLVYKIDKTCPIIWELRAMFFKESKLGKQLYQSFSTVEGLSVVIVTEALMKGKYESNEDIDMLMIGEVKIKDLNSVVSSLEKELGRELKYAVLKVEDFEFGKKKKDPILMNVLTKDKIILIGKDSDLI